MCVRVYIYIHTHTYICTYPDQDNRNESMHIHNSHALINSHTPHIHTYIHTYMRRFMMCSSHLYRLGEPLLRDISQISTCKYYGGGKLLSTDGTPDELMYSIVICGYADVMYKGNKIGKLGPGDSYGEFGTAFGIPQVSGVRMSRECVHVYEYGGVCMYTYHEFWTSFHTAYVRAKCVRAKCVRAKCARAKCVRAKFVRAKCVCAKCVRAK
jgi:hypothetical protein